MTLPSEPCPLRPLMAEQSITGRPGAAAGRGRSMTTFGGVAMVEPWSRWRGFCEALYVTVEANEAIHPLLLLAASNLISRAQ